MSESVAVDPQPAMPGWVMLKLITIVGITLILIGALMATGITTALHPQ